MTTTITGTTGVSQCQPGSVSQDDLAVGVAGVGPAFRAHNTSNQSVTIGVSTKVSLPAEDYDTANCYDTSTSRFTPNVAGYYRIAGTIRFNGSPFTQTYIFLLKNGATATNSVGLTAPSGSNACQLQISDLIFMNGTTDYIELNGFIVGTSPIFEALTTYQCASFSGELVRAA